MLWGNWYRRQGATQVLKEMSKLRKGELITIVDNMEKERTFKRVR